jgi:hypothetical protein
VRLLPIFFWKKTKAKDDKNHFALKKELTILQMKYGLKAIKNIYTPQKTRNWLRKFS